MNFKTNITKRLLPLGLSFVLAVFSLTSCQKDEQTSSFEEYTKELFQQEVSSNILNLHYSLENPAAFGIDDYEISLGSFSPDARSSFSTYLKDTISHIHTFDYDSLSLENQLTYDVLENYLNTQLSLSKYDLYQEPLSFSGGLHMELPILFAEYEFRNEQDIKDYLKMISLTDDYFDQVMSFEAEKSNNGLFMSQELCEKVIDSCNCFLENKQSHYLISSFESRLENLDISKRKKASYLRQNQKILETEVFPAYVDMISKLTKLKSTGKNDLGLCYLEQGKEYYEVLVSANTGCTDSLDTLFRRIENTRMRDLLFCAQLQEENSTLIQNCSYLEWQMTDPDTMVKRLQSEILSDFPTPPECSYDICYVEPSLEEYLAPAFYIVAPLDQYTENVIYINDGFMSFDIYGFTTLAHEGYPGHLYQTVMTYTYNYPEVRSILNFPGYVEGWATYVEMLSYSYAGLEEDVALFLSHNQASTLSLYASSDIGIHYYGWTFENMKQFWEGYGISNEDVLKEIYQLILSDPGNYLSYYVGYMEFRELKGYAQELYGPEYSDLQFHQAILDIGPAPFPILKKYLRYFYK